MAKFNPRKWLYFILHDLRGQPLRACYNRFLQQELSGVPPDTTKRLLIQLLSHCKQSVPYYANLMRKVEDSFLQDPEEYLKTFPILTKDIIRNHFDELKSSDLPHRKWYPNSTGGSTGEPVTFLQDREYATQMGAITLVFSRLVGHEMGESVAYLWGSERDIIAGSSGWKARIIQCLTNAIFLNAFRMTHERMREFITLLNIKRPTLIVAYVEAIYELARFAEEQGLEVAQQEAIITSASTLYPFMRSTIERVFQCKVFNRYGCREVGDIACERPGSDGLWVAPWGNYVEIVDSKGNWVPNGTEGEILVTSLTNDAMPFVRYAIGDRGALSPAKEEIGGTHRQVLTKVLGRITDMFKTKNGTLVDAGYFEFLMYFKDWVRRFQVIQKSTSCILFRIVKSKSEYQKTELDEISAKTKLMMGDDCQILFEFVDDIQPTRSGKYLFTISEV